MPEPSSPTLSLIDVLESQGQLAEAIEQGLNAEQLEAVRATEGPVLIIAGAGTGKTTVVTRRIATLIDRELAKPSEILALTFTDKAAKEMEDRVDALVPMGYVDTWIMTFHAFGDRILREHALDIGLSPDFKVMGKTEQILFLREHLFELSLDYYRPLSNPTKFLEALTSFISRCKDEDISAEQYQQWAERLEHNRDSSPPLVGSGQNDVKSEAGGQQSTVNSQPSELSGLEISRQQELARAYAAYERLKDENNLMDFGDQVARMLQLFRSRPEILKLYQQKFKYILVDEYQDTNFAQNQLVQLLAQEHHNICVVGDDDQSIYKFRGASISNILQFEKDFPGGRQVVLTQNYRSTQAVLDASYRMIQNNNPNRLEVANSIDKRLTAPEKIGGVEPEELFGQTLSDEADLVADKVLEIMATQPNLSYKDFAILVRANAHADPFVQSLNLKNIPYKFSGAAGLYEQQEVKLLISFLTTIGQASDSMNLFHLAASELYQAPMRDLIGLMDWAAGQNKSLQWALDRLEGVAEALELTDEGRVKLGQLKEDLNKYVELSRTEEVGKLLFAYLQEKRFLESLNELAEQPGLAGIEAAGKLQNISKFFDRFKPFNDLFSRRSVREFIDYLALMRAAGDDPVTAELDPDLDAVNVLTVHAAKGLEFPVVFMVNLVAERFPSRSRSETIPLPDALVKEQAPEGDFHVQEERRLFYVGMTRAKDQLFLTWGRDYGGRRERKISPFVLEALGKPSQVPTATKLSAIERINRYSGQLTLPMGVKPTEVDLNGIKLSPARIDDYESCPLRFYYHNVLHVPAAPSHGVVYGVAVHRAVEEFYKFKQRGETITKDQLLGCYADAWQSRGFMAEEHEKLRFDHGQQLLIELWDREHDNPHRPQLLEKDFVVKVDDVEVAGRWDRFDADADGNVTILDYKTSEGVDQKKADRRAKESVQLMIYALAYSQMYGKLPARVGLLFLDGNVFGSYEPTEKTLAEATQHILAVATGIKNGEFGSTPSQMVCEYCPFNLICPDAVK